MFTPLHFNPNKKGIFVELSLMTKSRCLFSEFHEHTIYIFIASAFSRTLPPQDPQGVNKAQHQAAVG